MKKPAITGLQAFAQMIDSIESLAEALENLRQNTTDDEWEQICSNPHVDALVSACMDVEALI
jgi:hypothetical protein